MHQKLIPYAYVAAAFPLKQMKRQVMMLKPAQLFTAFFLCCSSLLHAQTVTVNSLEPITPGVNYQTLQDAVVFANANAGTTILVIDASVTLLATQTISATTIFRGLHNANSKPASQIAITGTARHMNVTAANVVFKSLAFVGPNVTYDGSTGALTFLSSSTPGGGISSTAAATGLTIDSCVIAGCSVAGAAGGGILSGASLSVSNSVIAYNTSSNGGGGISSTGALTMSGTNTVSHNSAGWSGTIYTGAFAGGGVYANNNLTISGSLVCNANSAAQHGGGVYKHTTASTSFDATGLTLLQADSNRAGLGVNGSGGGIYTAFALELTGLVQGSVSNNTASATGGGIHAIGSLSLNNARVNNNRAIGTGGGLHLLRSSVLTNDTISGNRSNGGGGLALAYTLITDTLKLKGNILFEADSVVGGSAGANPGGGGIAFTGSVGVISASATDGLTALVINACKAIGTNHDGGGIGILGNGGTSMSIILQASRTSPITISNCFTTRNGGGISGRGNLDIRSVLFYADSVTGGASIGGGAIFRSNLPDVSTFISQCTFQQNVTASSNSGAAITVMQLVNLVPQIVNCTFYENRNTAASLGNGAAIFVLSPVAVKYCTFYGNTATVAGSFSIAAQTSTIDFNGNILQDNIGTRTLSAGVTGAYNIAGAAADVALLGAANNNQVNATPGDLFSSTALADNGGATPTLMIALTGLAHNYIPLDAASAVGLAIANDQRDSIRPVGCGYDAGSVERLTPDPVVDVTSSTGSSVLPGATLQLTGEPGGQTWLSRDPAIATVDNTGLVTGVALGSTWIVYRFGLNGCPSDSMEITVTFSLPLHLLQFSGNVQADGNQLQWVTVNEENTAWFDIEWSRDGSLFENVGRVTANNRPEQQVYSFLHRPSFTGNVNWYRLKMVDRDSRFTYSRIVRLNPQGPCERGFVLSAVSPSPFNNQLAVQYCASTPSKISARLLDMAGRIIASRDIAVQRGQGLFFINELGTLQAGIYILQLQDDKGVIISRKIMK